MRDIDIALVLRFRALIRAPHLTRQMQLKAKLRRRAQLSAVMPQSKSEACLACSEAAQEHQITRMPDGPKHHEPVVELLPGQRRR
jgi:hypothetical protein